MGYAYHTARMSVPTCGPYRKPIYRGRPAPRMSVPICGPIRPARKHSRSSAWSTPKARKSIIAVATCKQARKKPVSRSTKAGLHFPVARIGRFLMSGKHATSIGPSAPVYLAAVLEHLTAEILKLAGNAARDSQKSCIGPDHIQSAMRLNEELSKLLGPLIAAEEI